MGVGDPTRPPTRRRSPDVPAVPGRRRGLRPSARLLVRSGEPADLLVRVGEALTPTTAGWCTTQKKPIHNPRLRLLKGCGLRTASRTGWPPGSGHTAVGGVRGRACGAPHRPGTPHRRRGLARPCRGSCGVRGRSPRRWAEVGISFSTPRIPSGPLDAAPSHSQLLLRSNRGEERRAVLVIESLKGWYRSLASVDLPDLGGPVLVVSKQTFWSGQSDTSARSEGPDRPGSGSSASTARSVHGD